MTGALIVTSSAMGDASTSKRIALELIAGVKASKPDLSILERDLIGIPHVDIERLKAGHMPPEARDETQAKYAQFAETIISEVEAARLLVITAPMYCYTIPSTLKAWIEHLNQPGRAFAMEETGARGLLTGKTVFVVATRGSEFEPEDPLNYQENYLEAVLGTFGMNDVRFIIAEDTAHDAGKNAIDGICAEARRSGEAFGKDLSQA